MTTSNIGYALPFLSCMPKHGAIWLARPPPTTCAATSSCMAAYLTAGVSTTLAQTLDCSGHQSMFSLSQVMCRLLCITTEQQNTNWLPPAFVLAHDIALRSIVAAADRHSSYYIQCRDGIDARAEHTAQSRKWPRDAGSSKDRGDAPAEHISSTNATHISHGAQMHV
jgi:hypothetical protein